MDSAIFADRLIHSSSIERTFSGVAADCIALIDTNRGRLGFTSDPAAASAQGDDGQESHNFAVPGKIVSVVEGKLAADEVSLLRDISRGSSRASADWMSFECAFDTGVRDQIVLSRPKRPSASQDFTREFLHAMWPVLREDCTQEVMAANDGQSEDALLWTMAQKIDVAVMVLNSAALMLRMNLSARQMLEDAQVLKRSPRGLVAASDADTKLFREAVADCANMADPSEEKTVFLQHPTLGMRVPITLSRFFHDGRATPMVVMMMPTPPDPQRIEEIARSQGLTVSEARVATLMQLGLTNKEAALKAGLKEQTFNTYAKRVLNKLNVAGRAEMAQLLTWQSAGRLIR